MGHVSTEVLGLLPSRRLLQEAIRGRTRRGRGIIGLLVIIRKLSIVLIKLINILVVFFYLKYQNFDVVGCKLSI